MKLFLKSPNQLMVLIIFTVASLTNHQSNFLFPVPEGFEFDICLVVLLYFCSLIFMYVTEFSDIYLT